MDRRNYLRFAGGGVFAGGFALWSVTNGMGATGPLLGGALARIFARTRIEIVPAGESMTFTVGDGETLENLMIDISAENADARIEASGDDWVVRNVGFIGTCDIDKSDGFWNRLHVEGNGLVERVYLGDGCVSGIDCGGVGCPSSHSGHVEIRDSYFAGWSDNGLYTAHTAEKGRGTVHVHDCYFRDNNVAHLRVAADGTLVERCVIHNTWQVPWDNEMRVHSKGVYTGYGNPDLVVTVCDCDIDVTPENTNGGANAVFSPVNHSQNGECTTVSVSDSRVKGYVGGIVTTAGVHAAPDTRVPATVPTTALHAAIPWLDEKRDG